MSIAFIDLQAQRARIKEKIDAAIKGAVEGGAYIMGPQVAELEKRLSAFSGAAPMVCRCSPRKIRWPPPVVTCRPTIRCRNCCGARLRVQP